MVSPVKLFDRSFLLHGLKRSGNHAVINWLNCNNHFLILNNVLPVRFELENTAHDGRYDGFDIREKLPWRRALKNKIFLRKRHILISVEDHRLDAQALSEIISRSMNILIVRDPINLFASRIKKASSTKMIAYSRTRDWIFDRAVELWKEHCREAIGRTNTLNDKAIVYFDLWLTDAAYRSRILDRIDFHECNPAIVPKAISKFGGGSSFGDEMPDKDRLQTRKALLNGQELELLSSIENDSELMELRGELIARLERT